MSHLFGIFILQLTDIFGKDITGGEKMSKSKKINTEISATPVLNQPKTCFEQINKYGTYEIQPTADSDNKYPEIAQGLPRGGKSGTEPQSQTAQTPNSKTNEDKT